MKVFDFSNGVKGRQLGETGRPTYCSGNPVARDGGFLRMTTVTRGDATWELHSGAGRTSLSGNDMPLLPDTYLVPAICFCLGEMRCGTDSSWTWCVVGTSEWLKTALERGWIKHVPNTNPEN